MSACPQGRADTAANPLGLGGQDLAAGDRRQAGLESGEGVGIARIDGLAAREAGLQPGDIVLRVGNETVGSVAALDEALARSEEHTSELQSLMRISYAVFCLKKKKTKNANTK